MHERVMFIVQIAMVNPRRTLGSVHVSFIDVDAVGTLTEARKRLRKLKFSGGRILKIEVVEEMGLP